MTGTSREDSPLPEETREAIHQKLGRPDSVATCDDGKQVEVYTIRWRLSPTWKDTFDYLVAEIRGLIVLTEAILIPVVVYKKEKEKSHLAFVYGPDEKLIRKIDVMDDVDATAACKWKDE